MPKLSDVITVSVGQSKVENGKVVMSVTITSEEGMFSEADLFARNRVIEKLESRLKSAVVGYVSDADNVLRGLREKTQPSESTGKKRGRKPKAEKSADQ